MEEWKTIMTDLSVPLLNAVAAAWRSAADQQHPRHECARLMEAGGNAEEDEPNAPSWPV